MRLRALSALEKKGRENEVSQDCKTCALKNTFRAFFYKMHSLFLGGLILLDKLWIVLSGLYYKVFFKSTFLKKLKLFLYVIYKD